MPRGREEGGRLTLSTLFPTKIFATESETYVSISEYHLGRASKDSLDLIRRTLWRVSLSAQML